MLKFILCLHFVIFVTESRMSYYFYNGKLHPDSKVYLVVREPSENFNPIFGDFIAVTTNKPDTTSTTIKTEQMTDTTSDTSTTESTTVSSTTWNLSTSSLGTTGECSTCDDNCVLSQYRCTSDAYCPPCYVCSDDEYYIYKICKHASYGNTRSTVSSRTSTDDATISVISEYPTTTTDDVFEPPLPPPPDVEIFDPTGKDDNDKRDDQAVPTVTVITENEVTITAQDFSEIPSDGLITEKISTTTNNEPSDLYSSPILETVSTDFSVTIVTDSETPKHSTLVSVSSVASITTSETEFSLIDNISVSSIVPVSSTIISILPSTAPSTTIVPVANITDYKYTTNTEDNLSSFSLEESSTPVVTDLKGNNVKTPTSSSLNVTVTRSLEENSSDYTSEIPNFTNFVATTNNNRSTTNFVSNLTDSEFVLIPNTTEFSTELNTNTTIAVSFFNTTLTPTTTLFIPPGRNVDVIADVSKVSETIAGLILNFIKNSTTENSNSSSGGLDNAGNSANDTTQKDESTTNNDQNSTNQRKYTTPPAPINATEGLVTGSFSTNLTTALFLGTITSKPLESEEQVRMKTDSIFSATSETTTVTVRTEDSTITREQTQITRTMTDLNMDSTTFDLEVQSISASTNETTIIPVETTVSNRSDELLVTPNNLQTTVINVTGMTPTTHTNTLPNISEEKISEIDSTMIAITTVNITDETLVTTTEKSSPLYEAKTTAQNATDNDKISELSNVTLILSTAAMGDITTTKNTVDETNSSSQSNTTSTNEVPATPTSELGFNITSLVPSTTPADASITQLNENSVNASPVDHEFTSDIRRNESTKPNLNMETVTDQTQKLTTNKDEIFGSGDNEEMYSGSGDSEVSSGSGDDTEVYSGSGDGSEIDFGSGDGGEVDYGGADNHEVYFAEDDIGTDDYNQSKEDNLRNRVPRFLVQDVFQDVFF
ncbi:mucin-2-like isoform X1 [Zophobas morio]|uniref:mucin-2-like isoform X1 n=1 Tax=Zophobas morio TaxID=2755281 RepID=UPI0030834E5E